MDTSLFPTKGNLILAKSTLELSTKGYELLDRKRNILVREMMELIDTARDLQKKIDITFREAYNALQRTNITMGISTVEQISRAMPIEDSIKIRFRSVMGVEIPVVKSDKNPPSPSYGFSMTNSSLDEAVVKFVRVRELTLILAEVSTSVYRLAINIRKTQKRANSLKNVLIPRYEGIVKNIQDVLDEKEREEFTRLKVIKKQKDIKV
jgi:V/A-type H+-transporting ATPase subunit D